ncbi:bifunctional diaminohydroxyphosphoribosylaminopyrimidine deaminase/5-amino-6-(5-phosphoribosylamino)uracil reductase RibD [Umezawaea sp. Da 62-37]|uniref:bifunctional diaminohydroxyphosphoribosylaminopyrimidine deaminase/5-amino-6-(5-phosphoribosylamino)uracil reductase RibD n=1 Tax=Umezawaea sp. Da 62-37 TaxID=3075927 RepID=UPI0028F6F3BE|nr:bifunctional diaminohydroxyphosphoribosylaminopyrimidine deaminase/5-amino-6-(5-phosphoribosylamino)uracil reductase RibD [Umezawaea sp. Da 62-37]WNV83973.1 bifunctional diaminohydroxyphosphoribosylaminopyrimidine deaminase/5-amino-6-(5-phosphoribosylamino)uracil reductase RibD [Umezawaea sp. Da 62-37]
MTVDELVGRNEWQEVNEKYRRPFVVYKFAATLDGRIAATDGTSQWITSPESRAEVHLLRAGCQATIVGSGTQQADNPNLAVRGNDDPRLNLSHVSEPWKQPYRVIVDTEAKTPRDANVLNDAAPTIIAVADDTDASHLEDLAEVVKVRRGTKGLDIQILLEELYNRQIHGVFLEGGPTLAGSFVAAGVVDRVVNYIAPAMLGEGKSGLIGSGIQTMSDILRLELIEVSRSGPDIRVVARPKR